jgi:hypothetical protein
VSDAYINIRTVVTITPTTIRLPLRTLGNGASYITQYSMPVRFVVAQHRANVVREYTEPVTSAIDFLQRVRGDRNTGTCAQYLQGQSSPPATDLSSIRPEENGFVQTVMKAYNDHHHLVIRYVPGLVPRQPG